MSQDVGQGERDGRARLPRVVQNACDQLTHLHAAEEREGQVLQVPVDIVPHVAPHVLLHVHGQETCPIQGEVLEEQGREHQKTHVPQGVQGVARAQPDTEPSVEQLFEAARVRSRQYLHPEQRLQERDQEHEAECVEHRRHDHEDDGAQEEAGERAHVAE